MFDPDTTAAFTSSGKQADWMNGGARTSVSGASDPETTGSTPAAPDKTGTAALSSLFARASADTLNGPPALAAKPAEKTAETPLEKPIAVADAGDTAVPVAPVPPAAEKIIEPRGRAYLFRGVAGLIYSRGIDKLAGTHQARRHPRQRPDLSDVAPVAEQAISDYRRDPQPITLIGHSMGGDSALDFAEMLNRVGIPVSLLVTYDPSRIADDVPPNVERYINIYQSSNIMGGGNVVQGSRFHGHYASYNLKDHTEIIHINIEKADRIQEQLVTKVAQLAATPADRRGRGGADSSGSSGRRRDRIVGFGPAGCGPCRRYFENARRDLSRAAVGARPDQFGVAE